MGTPKEKQQEMKEKKCIELYLKKMQELDSLKKIGMAGIYMQQAEATMGETVSNNKDQFFAMSNQQQQQHNRHGKPDKNSAGHHQKNRPSTSSHSPTPNGTPTPSIASSIKGVGSVLSAITGGLSRRGSLTSSKDAATSSQAT